MAVNVTSSNNEKYIHAVYNDKIFCYDTPIAYSLHEYTQLKVTCPACITKIIQLQKQFN